jgi:hypothetical protein
VRRQQHERRRQALRVIHLLGRGDVRLEVIDLAGRAIAPELVDLVVLKARQLGRTQEPIP